MKSLSIISLALMAGIALTGCSNSKTVSQSGAPAPTAKAASRVDIKHAVDPDASKIDRTPKDITVDELVATTMPNDVKGNLEAFPEQRIGPFETSTYKMDGTIKSIQHRKDGDYYMVVEGSSGKQAIVEVPDPENCKTSPLYSDIKSARESLEKRYHPTDEVKNVDDKVKIEGVGFFGFRGRPGSGSQGRGARLMPGTGVEFEK